MSHKNLRAFNVICEIQNNDLLVVRSANNPPHIKFNIKNMTRMQIPKLPHQPPNTPLLPHTRISIPDDTVCDAYYACPVCVRCVNRGSDVC